MPNNVSVVQTTVSGHSSGAKTASSSASAIAAGTAELKRGVIVKVPSTAGESVYVGPAGVTSSNGFQLEPGDKEMFPASTLASLYVVTASGSVAITYFAV